MMYKRKSSIFRFYSADKNKKGKFHFVPFKFLFLSLYMFGVYYVFLNTSLENSSIECFKIINIHERNLGEKEKNSNSSQRKKNLNHKKEDVNKTKHNTNEIIYNEEKLDENNFSVNNYVENEKTKIENSNSINNINYNDISKQLTRQELFDVLNSFNECPPKEDLLNLWRHTLGLNKERLNALLNELFNVFPKNSIEFSFVPSKCGNTFSYTTIWFRCISECGAETSINETRFTKEFYELINNKPSIDDIRDFIFSCLEQFEQMYKDLYKECESNVIYFKKKQKDKQVK
ncbi:hypothetical protein PFMALIP_04087 [Plasmodium falciparum MaliPS096_E11]|uniref:Plasmodium RESA N-terminal domain-containing protein n=1 Tax=Plasmodium falciparum MaliPS096_E11 TaxID=1036727 RepID=A0A024WL11_PLAFA|nr:hypothetical protein PFMALIP_04087 [Plasmodium falciparum MaliPS096_E11]